MAIPIEVYLAGAAALLVAGLVWFVRATGDPRQSMEPSAAKPVSPEQARHSELIEARRKIERQLEVLQTPIGVDKMNAPPSYQEEIAELEAVLDGINRELHGLSGQ